MTSTATTSPAVAATAIGSRHVAWMFELVVKPRGDADFRELMAEMAEATDRNEPGTLDYQWYVSDDGRRLHLFERYADADAAMIHIGTFGERYMTNRASGRRNRGSNSSGH